MKVTKIMAVPCEQIQQYIQEGVMSDIYQATGKKVSIDDIKPSYQYQKTLKNRIGKRGNVKTSIDELNSHSYKASFFSAQGVNTLCYQWRYVDEEHTEVIYEEDYQANTKSNDWNFRLMSLLYKRSNQKRMDAILKQMASILENAHHAMEVL